MNTETVAQGPPDPTLLPLDALTIEEANLLSTAMLPEELSPEHVALALGSSSGSTGTAPASSSPTGSAHGASPSGCTQSGSCFGTGRTWWRRTTIAR
jgi:hypothetical protein